MRRHILILCIIAGILFTSPATASTIIFAQDFESQIWENFWIGDWVSHNTGNSLFGISANGDHDGMLTSRDLDTSSASAINIDFWIYKVNTDRGSDLFLYIFDGQDYQRVADLDRIGRDNQWLNYTTTITDSRYFIPNFKVRFEARNLFITANANYTAYNERVQLDSVRVSIESEQAKGCKKWSTPLEDHRKAGRAYMDIYSPPPGHDPPRYFEHYYAVGSNVLLNPENYPGQNEYPVINEDPVVLASIDDGITFFKGVCTTEEIDWDGDGYPADEECDDLNAGIYPGAEEKCNDGIDQDCDGSDATDCLEKCHEFTSTIGEHLTAGRAYGFQLGGPGCGDSTFSYFAHSPERDPLWGESIGQSGSDMATLHTLDNGLTYFAGSCP